MGTKSEASGLSATLFGKTRRAIFSLLFTHADEAFYLRQLVRAAGVGLGAVQRELNQLTEAGIIRRSVRGRQVYFQANPDCPIFEELKNLVTKTAGVADVLKAALAPLADRIRIALIYGSVARGKEKRASDVDLLVVGDAAFSEIVSALAAAQQTLRREVNPTVYPPGEFTSKLAAGHHFLKTITKNERLFLIGDERELARLAQKRLMHLEGKMINPKVYDVLAELRRQFEALYGERLVKMVLYGSEARGEAEPGSDIDVLVVLKGHVSPCEEIKRTAKDVADLSLEYGEVIACVFVSEDAFEREHSPLLLNVRREGVPV